MAAKIPNRGQWARLPTPIQKLERLSAELGVEVWVKRDDQTGFELSGNKIRKLQFLAQDALEKGATCLITCGGVQSNHCRATAALAARLGLRCVLLLRGEEPATRSNFLLSKLFGAEVFFLDHKQYYEGMGELKVLLESQIRAQGGKAYFIPEGGSNGLGCFGYADAFLELEGQLKNGEGPDSFDAIVFAHGSGGTQAGLILGKLMHGDALKETRIVGVNVCYEEKESFRLVKDALWSAIQQYQLPYSFMAEDIEVLGGYLGAGYAVSTEKELQFLTKVARLEGLLVDPVYTGKALYGLYDSLKKDPGAFGKKVLFWHTGGGFGLFKVEESEWKNVL